MRARLTESLAVPRSVLEELREHARHIEELVATLEEMSDKKGLKRIRSGLKDYEKGGYVVLEDPKKIRALLGD